MVRNSTESSARSRSARSASQSLRAATRKEPSKTGGPARKAAAKAPRKLPRKALPGEEGYIPSLKDQTPLNNRAFFKKKQLPENLTAGCTADDIYVSNYKLIYSYGQASDRWHLSYRPIAFEDSQAKEGWKSVGDTATFIDFNDWVQEEMDDLDMCLIGFFCTWTSDTEDIRLLKSWKECDILHAWVAALRPIKGKAQGKELLFWGCNSTIEGLEDENVSSENMVEMQRKLLDFAKGYCQLDKVWLGGFENGVPANSFSLTQDFLHRLCKNYNKELPTGDDQLKSRGFRLLEMVKPHSASTATSDLDPDEYDSPDQDKVESSEELQVRQGNGLDSGNRRHPRRNNSEQETVLARAQEEEQARAREEEQAIAQQKWTERVTAAFDSIKSTSWNK